MHLYQALLQLSVCDFVLVEEVMAIFIDRHADVLALRLSFAGAGCRQIYFNPFHVHLAQAHHHEAGQQKEHDVDQWDDLDPPFLVRNWRLYEHWDTLRSTNLSR